MFDPDSRPTADPSKALASPDMTSEMSRAMQYFREMSGPLLGRYNSAAEIVFSRMIPRLGESELSIKHQLVAIAAVQEQFNNTNAARYDTGNIATKHYSSALRILADQTRAPSLQIMLVSCLLSVALESIRYDTQRSFVHLQAGLRMIREWKNGPKTGAITSHELDEMLQDYIEPIFAQLEATAAMTGDAESIRDNSNRDLQWRRPQVPDIFKDFSAAREKFWEIGHRLYILNEPFKDSPQFRDLEDLWDQWEVAFRAFSDNIDQEAELEQLEALQLGVHYRTHRLTFICQSTPTTEMAWDEYTDVFRDSVRICQELLGNEAVYDTTAIRFSTSFCKDPGILPPCWQIAVNCRDSSIRRRAIESIKEHHRLCGDTDDCSAAAIAERVMELEEADLNVSSCEDVPESHRVRPLEADLTTPGRLRLTYTRSPYLVPEVIDVPIYLESAPHVLPFKLFPLGESVRLAGYQGLVRPRTYSCRCKSYGIK